MSFVILCSDCSSDHCHVTALSSTCVRIECIDCGEAEEHHETMESYEDQRTEVLIQEKREIEKILRERSN